MKTYRRDRLLREVLAGKMLAKCTMSEDIMYGRVKSSETPWLPARISEQHGDIKDGFLTLSANDFTRYGGATINENGIIHLHIHSNCSFDFKPVQGVL